MYTKANICVAAVLQRCECRRRGQQLAQHDRSKLADSLALQVELRDAVLAQRGERDPAEVRHTGVLEHRRGQMAGCVARNFVEADAVTPGHRAIVYEKHTERWLGEVREVGCHRVFAFLSAGADTKANTLGWRRT